MFIKVYMHIKIAIVQWELVRYLASKRYQILVAQDLSLECNSNLWPASITVLRKETDLKEQWGKWGTSISSDFNDMAALYNSIMLSEMVMVS